MIIVYVGVVAPGGDCGLRARKSSDMQEHISRFNLGLQNLDVDATLSTGLIGSLSIVEERIRLGTAIIETHNYVRTLKDEILAREIKTR